MSTGWRTLVHFPVGSWQMELVKPELVTYTEATEGSAMSSVAPPFRPPVCSHIARPVLPNVTPLSCWSNCHTRKKGHIGLQSPNIIVKITL
jgi:hypothetical protein